MDDQLQRLEVDLGASELPVGATARLWIGGGLSPTVLSTVSSTY